MLEIESATKVEDLEDEHDLDTLWQKLGVALMAIIKGQFVHEIRIIDRTCVLERKYKPNGRQIALLVRQK
mgnify:CR=1 FL=1